MHMRMQLARIWRESVLVFKRRVKRSTVFSRTALLLLLLAIPRHDPSNFSAQTGRSLLLDPGVSPSLCFSAQSRGGDIPDPGLFLSLFNTQEITVSFCDLSKCYMLSICLLGILKLLCRHIMCVSRFAIF